MEKTKDKYRSFGRDGLVYEVIEEIDQKTVKIRVVETGEELEYSKEKLDSDPIAA